MPKQERHPALRLPGVLFGFQVVDLGSIPSPATTATTVPTAATALPAAFLARLGFVDGQRSAVMLLAVERLNGGLGFLVAAHLDEAEPLGAAGVAILDDLGRHDRAVLPKQLRQVTVV